MNNKNEKNKLGWLKALAFQGGILALSIMSMQGSEGALRVLNVFLRCSLLLWGFLLIACIATSPVGLEKYRRSLPAWLSGTLRLAIAGTLAWQGQPVLAVMYLVTASFDALLLHMGEIAHGQRMPDGVEDDLSNHLDGQRSYNWSLDAKRAVDNIPKEQLDKSWDWSCTYLVELARRLKEQERASKEK